MLNSNYLFKDLVGDFFDIPVLKNNIMKADVFTENNMYIMEIEMPGFKKEDITVDFNDGYLTIIAKKIEEKIERDYIKRERFYGTYQRSFYVGDIVDDNINASFHDGILKLTFPKQNERSNNKKAIEIK